jgi:periplasmic divalent cation tolerance protein
VIEIATTVPSEEIAAHLAREIVDRRLGACVQVFGPVTSCYRWKGNIEISREWRVTIKTIPEQRDPLVAFLQEQHPYEMPEIAEHPIHWLEPAFRRWIEEQTS